jgi:hypothetical protein
MIPQILPSPLGAQHHNLMARPYPPKAINITNQAGISTKDPRPADRIQPPNGAEYFSER